MTKYGNKPTTDADGRRHASGWEAEYWHQLELRERAGDLSGLQRQVRVPLEGQKGPIRYASGRQAYAVVDFKYTDASGVERWEDTKGFQTDQSKLKFAVLAAMGIKVEIRCKVKPRGRQRLSESDLKKLRR